MEMTTIYIWGTIGALLCLVVGAMLGYARQEAQQVHANALQRDHLQAVDAKWRQMLEEAHAGAILYEDRWKFADKYREAIVEALDTHGLMGSTYPHHTPRMMLVNLLGYVSDCSLDPSVSQKAKNLHTAGVRKGAKRGRLQMQKLMQKSIDNQALTIDGMRRELFHAQGRRQLSREAVLNVLDDKVALPGVRKAIKQAIIVETGRLYAVAAKKGA
jgi:hypothetical protein